MFIPVLDTELDHIMKIICFKCLSEINIVYLKPGDIAICKNCGKKNVVPQNEGELGNDPGTLDNDNHISEDVYIRQVNIFIRIGFHLIGIMFFILYSLERFRVLNFPKPFGSLLLSDTYRNLAYPILKICFVLLLIVAIYLQILRFRVERKDDDNFKSEFGPALVNIKPLINTFIIILSLELLMLVYYLFNSIILK